MKKRRIMALLLAGLMTVSTMLTGCGQQKEESKQSSQTQQSGSASGESQVASSTQEVEELEPYTVTWWMRGEESKDHDKVMEAVNARIQELLPNTTLDVVWVANSEYKDRWNKALAAGEKIDIGWSASWVNNPTTDVANGVVLQVDDLLAEYGQGIVEAVGGWDVLDLNRIEGGLYHILAWQGLVGNRKVLSMNKKLADAMPAGWLEETEKIFLSNQAYTIEDITENMDRIEEALIVAKEQGIYTEGMLRGAMSNILYPGVVAKDSFRLLVTEENGVFTVQSWFDNPVYKEYADKLYEWWKKGYYREDVLLVENTDEPTENHTLRIVDGVSNDWAAKELEKWGVETTGCLLMPNNELTKGFTTGVVLPTTGENPERSMQLLNLVYTDAELYRLLVYGIEGDHYITNSDGTITRPASGERDYEGAVNWTLGTCMNGYAENAGTIGYYEGLLEVQQTAEASPLLGFSFSADAAGVKNEQTNIQAIIKEYDWSFFTDDHDARYAEFCAKLKEVGMDTYMDAYKKALTEYVTANNLGTVAP